MLTGDIGEAAARAPRGYVQGVYDAAVPSAEIHVGNAAADLNDITRTMRPVEISSIRSEAYSSTVIRAAKRRARFRIQLRELTNRPALP